MFLSPLSSTSNAQVAVPSPLRFRAPVLPILHMSLNHNQYVRARGNTASRENGLRYEARAKQYLRDELIKYSPDYFIDSPEITFIDSTKESRTCYPDGILTTGSAVLLIEIKFQHVPEAWWQMERLYKPLLQYWYPRLPVRCLEMCHTFDPATPFPVPVQLFDSPIAFLESGAGFGVMQWRP